MASILEGSDSFTGINWWIGQVAPRETWAENTLMKNDKDVGSNDRKGENNVYPNRVKVKVVGYHDSIEDLNELPFASVLGNPFISSGYGSAPNLHQLEGGESVLGVWLDGDDEQKPAITNVFLKSQSGEDGKTTDLKSNTYVRPHRRRGRIRGGGVETGKIQGKNVSDNTPIKEIDNKKTDGKYDPETGRTEEVLDPSNTDNTLNNDKLFDDQADKSSDRPTCKRDNSISEITGALGDFSKLLIRAQNYGNFYGDSVTGMAMNFDGELDLITKKIGGVMTAKVNSIRDAMFSNIEEKVNEFTNKLIPENQKTQFAEGVRGVTGTLYCLFENLIKGLKETIGDFLKSLIGKLLNAPLCAAEQFLGALLENIMDKIKSLIGPILNSLSSTLGGALGSVNSIIDKALAGIGLLYDFIGCQEFKCPLPSRFDNKLGPSQSERDDFTNALGFMSNISNAIGGGDDPSNLPSMFKRTEGDAATVAALVGECETNVLRCGPPIIEIFGGSGVGGAANAVVNNIGQIIGANILDRGLGYTENPPYVTFKDACGDGQAASGSAIIGDDGGIDAILIEAPGYNYNNTYTITLTTSGVLESDVVSELANSDSESMVGQISDVAIIDPGSGYNTTDTLEVDGAQLNPVVLGGRIVRVEVVNGGTGFTTIPEVTVNSDTGIGANLRPVLKFVSVTEVSEELDPTQVIEVIDCVEKPLSRRRIGS